MPHLESNGNILLPLKKHTLIFREGAPSPPLPLGVFCQYSPSPPLPLGLSKKWDSHVVRQRHRTPQNDRVGSWFFHVGMVHKSNHKDLAIFHENTTLFPFFSGFSL